MRSSSLIFQQIIS